MLHGHMNVKSVCSNLIFFMTVYQGRTLRNAWQYLLSIHKLLSNYDANDRNMVEINYRVFTNQCAYCDDTILYTNKN